MFFLTSFFVSSVITYAIIRYQYLYATYVHDNNLSGVQKFHSETVPRIGGVSLMIGLMSAAPPLWLVLSLLPVFAIGLLEDVTKLVLPRYRLLFSFLSALIAFYGLDVGLLRIGWDWFDGTILNFHLISLVLTIVMIGGVSHAANIIDGFNGLLLGYALMAFSLFAWVVWQLDDQFLFSLLLATIGALFGVLFFNFPKGKIFLGDGGAYIVGFLMAIFSLMLVRRHPQVSSWFPLLVFIYPVFETFFSIYRKKFLRAHSPGVPDGIHLHMLVYKRIIPHYFGVGERGWRRNALTSVVIWIFTLPPLLTALLFWDKPWVMVLGVVLFCFYYIWFYFRIIKFKLKGSRLRMKAFGS